MPYSAELEERMDLVGLSFPEVTKKAMFGGIGYLVSGNMAFGIWKDSLVVRCGKESYESSLSEDHVSEFDITGKAMTGWVMVSPVGIQSKGNLKRWMQKGYGFASSLPLK